METFPKTMLKIAKSESDTPTKTTALFRSQLNGRPGFVILLIRLKSERKFLTHCLETCSIR